jgi:DNA mismatch repair protein MutS2
MTASPDQIDLHGLTVDDALSLVDDFLRRASRARLLRVWIIHGKGTGALRSAVRSYLVGHPLVLNSTMADGNRGGPGATQVDIK